MPPWNQTARETLALSGETTFIWAVFDPDWYLAAYPAVRAELTDTDAAAVRQYYLDRGQPQGHAPNRFFDEAFFLANTPAAAEAMRTGHAESGFDAYCRAGGRYRSPHWLFDEARYLELSPDLTDETLEAHGIVNGYHHYLRVGNGEGRSASRFFDRTTYLSQLAADELAEAETAGPFIDYLQRLSRGGSLPPTSLHFNPAWYLRQYPAVAEAIAAGLWSCPLHHYLANSTPTEFDPLAMFSERYYLTRYPDILQAVEVGQHRNGYEHFLRTGARERRSPHEQFDMHYYISAHPSVRAELERGAVANAFEHYLTIGLADGLPVIPPPDDMVTEGQAKTLFRLRAESLLPLFARQPLDFTCASAADLSVIMVLHNQFALTMMALSSLRQNHAGAIQLILVDSGSSDESRFISRYVHGATLLRFDTNLGFVRACNAGLIAVTGETVLFLNNDVELAAGAVAAGLRRLRSDPRIGVVGGKIIRTHGRLQEAGSVIWRDGVSLGYLRDASPLAPEANFVREVDFCSGAFLMVRTDLLRTLEGFSDAFAPAYYEDADLCARAARAGFKVIYDPAVVIHHYEYASATSFRAVEAAAARSREAFIRRNWNHLRHRYLASTEAEVFARSTNARQRRILFIEDQVPLRLLGSGFVRSNDLIRVMAGLGFHVTVFPMATSVFNLAAVYADMPDTVEVMHDRSFQDLARFLENRDGYYDTIWIARTHNLDRTRPILEQAVAGKERPPRIVLDTEAIASVREALRASLSTGQHEPETDTAILRELHNAPFCQRIIAVSEPEAARLRTVGINDVSVLGHIRDLSLTPRPFDQRSGMLFIGAVHDIESPNYDGLCWFIDEVLPLVERELGSETRLSLVSYTTGHVALDRFQDHARISLHGTVADTEALYASHRVFIAPTRFAAGTPYKIYEAASFGVPIVATDLLRQQLGWESGQELLTAEASDPASFARHIVSLYRDSALWQRIRDTAARRLAAENGREHYVQALGRLLGPPMATRKDGDLPLD